MTRCPGQDRRYWTEDAVFEVPCPECGAAVEFFKDEAKGRCSKCGHRFRNPGIDFGCAQWCALAEQCLGFAPERQPASTSGDGALAGRLIQEVKTAFQDDSDRLTHALKVYHYAKEFVAAEGGNPRVALAAALLLDVGSAEAPADASSSPKPGPTHQRILDELGVDEQAARAVCGIIDNVRGGKEVDCIECRVVRDAETLARMTAQGRGDDPDKLRTAIQTRLLTEAARTKARALFQLT